MRPFIAGNVIHTPGILLTLLRNVRKQEKFLDETLGPLLAEVRKTSDESLGENDFKKINKYYGLAVPAILGEAICVLRGSKMTLRERMACTYLGAMTGLFDDFFDKHNMPDELLLRFLEKGDSISGVNSSQQLYLKFYQTSLLYFDNWDLIQFYRKKVYEAQIESRKQSVPGLSREELTRITINKGGVSVLLYRSVFAHPLSEEEVNALYFIGGLMQLGNDIFDVYKDSQNNIETLGTTAQNINDLRTLFLDMTSQSFNAFYRTDYGHNNIRKFLRMVSMSLCSRCHVCLDQLEEKERLSQNIFSPKQYERKDLVCDMDTAGNKWRSILYYIKQDVRNGS